MRNAFAEEAANLAREDEQYFLLSGDIGNRLFNTYKARFSERFLNCGVAEANMTGVAAGMAMAGLRPMTYTIAAFNTARCLEQIRVDVCYHNLPVTIVGVGAGLSYAGLGYTHHATEDIAMMRVLPNMTVLCPGDVAEVRAAMHAAHRHDGPVYIRLGKKGEPNVHTGLPDFQIGKAITLSDGDEVCLLGVGTSLPEVETAARLLTDKGVSVRLVSFHTIKPLDYALLTEIFETFKVVSLIEEHSCLGGAGSAVAEWLAAQSNYNAKFISISLPDEIFQQAGTQEHARRKLGLLAQDIARKVLLALETG
jgi:transketolase